MKQAQTVYKILIAGEGGQGVQSLAYILTQALFKAGLEVSFVPNYGLEQRGGMSLAYIQVSNKKIVYPRFNRPDLLILMAESARPRVAKLISQTQQVLETEPHKELLKENKLPAHTYNMLTLGILAKILADKKIIKTEEIRNEIKSKLGKKLGLEDNLKAFEVGTGF
ncbi:MAG: 2-oxoacid:acceptor oxidoreductase family protein [Patescibacteria group bacterium]